MIVRPSNESEWNVLVEFIQKHAHVARSDDLHMFGWVSQDQLKMVVALGGFLGKVCQIHVAMLPGFNYTPKLLLNTVFAFVFDECGVEKLIGIVNSKNRAAMKYDLHLGFEEEYRMEGVHDDGGDLVILTMPRGRCVYVEPRHTTYHEAGNA